MNVRLAVTMHAGGFCGNGSSVEFLKKVNNEPTPPPSVRLAMNRPRMESASNNLTPPSVRFAMGAGVPCNYEQGGFIHTAFSENRFLGKRCDIPAVNNTLNPEIRLAHQLDSQCDNSIKEGGYNNTGAPLMPAHQLPALLVSYYYVEPFLKNRAQYHYRDWVMDSGAFSAHNSGVNIDLNKYIDKCLELMATDPSLTEVFALDVIPKAKDALTIAKAAEQSEINTEEMWRQGVPAIPTFHRGEPEEFLYRMAKEFPKIGIGGVALLRGDQKFLFCEQVFARVWPKKIHGLGMSSDELIFGLPFHSVDATNWELAPCAFGNWMKFGSMSVRGSNQDLRSQVKHYLEMEAKARVRWAKQMQELEELDKRTDHPWMDRLKKCTEARANRPAPTVRLAVDAGSADGQRAADALVGHTGPLTPAKEKPAKKAKTVKAAKVVAIPEVKVGVTAEATVPEKVSGYDPKWDDYWKNRNVSEYKPK